MANKDSKDITGDAKTKQRIEFFPTTNPWINNGLATLLNESKRRDILQFSFNNNSVELESKEEDINDCISKVLLGIASRTYNFSTDFIIINLDSEILKYRQPSQYPTSSEEIDLKWKIEKDDKEILKRRGISNPQTKLKVWKTRLSYNKFNNKNNYLSYGLNFNRQDEFKKLQYSKKGNKQCILCGCSISSLMDIKESFNPFMGEHHNNVVEGISAQSSGREKLKCCPKCFTLSLFSLFNPFLPFYNVINQSTTIAIPNTHNIKLLLKVQNNLSYKGQFIDFSSSACTSYSTNIKELPYSCPEAGMLALIHNIKNRYTKDEPEEVGFFFEELKKEEFIDVKEWLFISNSITHLTADTKVFKLLDIYTSADGKEYYLVLDALRWFPKKFFDEYAIRKFFHSILTVQLKPFSESLFSFAKKTQGGNFAYNRSFEIFRRYFLDIILKEGYMLEEKVYESCKKVAGTIGKAFSNEVGMLTKLAYATEPNEFKAALQEATFRIAKKSALDGKTSFYLNTNDLDTLFKELNKNIFDEIKNYFVSFMSAYVISSNYRKDKG